VGRACGAIEVVRAGRDASGTKARASAGVQDFGVGAFNGWDDFQDVVIDFSLLLIGGAERS
jgi:hypothetical protein